MPSINSDFIVAVPCQITSKLFRRSSEHFLVSESPVARNRSKRGQLVSAGKRICRERVEITATGKCHRQ